MVLVITNDNIGRARDTDDGKPAINFGVIIAKEAISMPPTIVMNDKKWFQPQTDTNLQVPVPIVLPTVLFFWCSSVPIVKSSLFSPRKCSAALLPAETDKTLRQICTANVACSWGIWGLLGKICSLKASWCKS